MGCHTAYRPRKHTLGKNILSTFEFSLNELEIHNMFESSVANDENKLTELKSIGGVGL